MTFIVVSVDREDQPFKTFDAAERWAKANLPEGSWEIVTQGSSCCG